VVATAQRYVDIAGISMGSRSSACSLPSSACNLQSPAVCRARLLDCSPLGRPCMVGRAHSVSHAVRMQSAKARSKKIALANSAGGASQLKQVRLLGARRLSCSVVMAAANLAWTLARGVTHGELCGLMCRIKRRCRRFAAYAGSRSMPRRNGRRWRSTWLPSTASRRSRTVSRTRCSGRVASCVHSVVVVARIECIWCIWCIRMVYLASLVYSWVLGVPQHPARALVERDGAQPVPWTSPSTERRIFSSLSLSFAMSSSVRGWTSKDSRD
jgi:hypothetical protein